MIYRNRKLLALAKEAPRCFCCNSANDGTVVAAHRNEGKGMGMKASDAGIAFLCGKCHYEIDNGKSMSRKERRSAMDRAISLTLQWMIEDGWLSYNENR